MNDIKLGYSGASGGFLVLHFLLLSNQFNTKFNFTGTFDEMLSTHWNISNPSRWKKSEVWPDNTLTKNLPNQRLFFFCNPNLTHNDWQSCEADALVLYTDIDSQIALGKYKNAGHVAVDPERYTIAKSLLQDWHVRYKIFRQPHWPVKLPFNQVWRLPELLDNKHYQEIKQNLNKLKLISPEEHKNTAVKFKNDMVTKLIVPYLEQGKYNLKLQDFVNTDGEVLCNMLNIGPVNNKQHMLISNWKKLHTKSLLNSINIF